MIFLPLGSALPYNPANTTDYKQTGQLVFGVNADDNSLWYGITCRNLTGSALTANRIYQLGNGYAPSGQHQFVVTSSATTGVFRNFNTQGQGTTTTVTGGWSTSIVGCAHEATANNAVGVLVIFGFHDALVDGTTDVAIGDSLRLAASKVTALIQDVAVGSWDISNPPPMSCAVANQASTANSANTTRVNFIGQRVFVAAV